MQILHKSIKYNYSNVKLVFNTTQNTNYCKNNGFSKSETTIYKNELFFLYILAQKIIHFAK